MKFERSIVRFLSGIVLSFSSLASFNLSAQTTQPILSQPLIYERSHKDSDRSFLVISMGDKGLALIRDTEKFESNKRSWEAIFLDSTLTELWTAKFEVDQRMNIFGHDYRDGNVYLIFEEPENVGRQVNLIEMIPSEK